MCGISACALKRGAAGKVLYGCLKRLEYRGYDSVGVAALDGGHLTVLKDKGRIDEVESKLRLSALTGLVGIGHTRWATHGMPVKENAHPHTDCKNRIAVVHNGIIENFVELRESLEARGHEFKSRTDTETVAHMIEEEIDAGHSLPDAVRATAKRLHGSYAIAVVSETEPDKVVCVRRENPLAIGVAEDGNYCASDIPAFLPMTRKAMIIEDGDMAILTADSVEVVLVDTGEKVGRGLMNFEWNEEVAKKGGYPHFMIKEIFEQPLALRNASRPQKVFDEVMAAALDHANKVFLIGCGTSYHACVAASYAFSKLAKLSAVPVVASEFIENFGDSVGPGTAVLAVSQSGETADTLSAIRMAKEKGATILAITNVMGSTLTRLASAYVGQNAGPERGVAATKTFTTQVVILAQLVMALAAKRGMVSLAERKKFEKALARLPDVVTEVILAQDGVVKGIADKYERAASMAFLGRGINAATALEGRLKLLEVAYIPAMAYPAGESKHGFIALVEEGYPVVFVVPMDDSRSRTMMNISEMKARGCRTIGVIDQRDLEAARLLDEVITVPSGMPEVLSPALYVVPLQLLAYHVAVNKGYDPDFPRNLAKSVTVN